MRSFKHLALTTALSLATLTVAASASDWTGKWGSLTKPKSFEDGTPYCMVWYSDVNPMMGITATAEGPSFSVSSDAFVDLPEKGVMGAYAIIDGEEISMSFVKKPAPEQEPGLVVGALTEKTFAYLSSKIALKSYSGEMLTIKVLVAATRVELTQDFPLNSVAGNIAAFNECREKL